MPPAPRRRCGPITLRVLLAVLAALDASVPFLVVFIGQYHSSSQALEHSVWLRHYTTRTDTLDLVCLCAARGLLLFFAVCSAPLLRASRYVCAAAAVAVVVKLAIFDWRGATGTDVAVLSFGAATAAASLVLSVAAVRADVHARESGTAVDDAGAEQPGGANLRRLMGLAAPEKWLIVSGTVALVFASGSQMVVPSLFGALINTIGNQTAVVGPNGTVPSPAEVRAHHQTQLNHVALMLLCFFALTSVFTFIRGSLFTLAGERVVARLRCRLFAHIAGLDVAFYDKTQSGELVNRLAADTAVIQNAVTVNVSMALRWLGQAVVGMVILFVLSPSLTGIMLAVVPAVSIGAVCFGRFVRKLSNRYQKSLARAGEVAGEVFSNIRTVRSFAMEPYESSRYGHHIAVSYENGAKRAWAYGLFAGGIGLFAYSAVALVLWYGGGLVIRGEMQPGTLISFLFYTIYIAVAMGGLSGLYGTLMAAVGSSKRMFQILDEQPTIRSKRGGRGGAGVGGSLRFRGISSATYEAAGGGGGGVTTTRPTVTEGVDAHSLSVRLLEDPTAAVNNAHGDGAGVDAAARGQTTPWVTPSHGAVRGDIIFDHVSFSYPTREDVLVLDDVSFGVEPGKTVALVGPSGAGKSTVVSLIERYYDPTKGSIRLDGYALEHLHPEWLHRHVVIVSQEPVLFAAPIYMNILYGTLGRSYQGAAAGRTRTPRAVEGKTKEMSASASGTDKKKVVDDDDEEEEYVQTFAELPMETQAAVRRAAKDANALSFIEEFPSGFDTKVGERGVQLSGGQKQRVAIARAVLLDPKVLLLDEATSALDAESEALVQAALDQMIADKSRTTIVIAHRLSTVRNADEVLVVDHGKIVERGTHDTLVKKPDGLYRHLVKRQLGGEH